MEESNALVNRNKTYVIHTEVLEMVFEVAFTVLRMGDIKDPLLPHSLKILTKHSKLVNLEIVLDLIQSLSDMMEDLPFHSMLQASLCTFNMLQGRGRAIEYDLQKFYCVLYQRMREILEQKDLDSLLIEVLNSMLLESRNLAKTRITSYVKRLLLLSLECNPTLADGLLKTVMLLYARFQKWLPDLLEGQPLAGGLFSNEDNNPDLPNPLVDVCWALPKLKRCFDKQDDLTVAMLENAKANVA